MVCRLLGKPKDGVSYGEKKSPHVVTVEVDGGQGNGSKVIEILSNS